jgi:hypothetical protein
MTEHARNHDRIHGRKPLIGSRNRSIAVENLQIAELDSLSPFARENRILGIEFDDAAGTARLRALSSES